MSKLVNAPRRYHRLLALALGIAVLAFGAESQVRADNPPYGVQYHQKVTFATGLVNATLEGGTLSGGAGDTPNFHAGEFAAVLTPCGAIDPQPRPCLDGVLTEWRTQVFLDSVGADGTITWTPDIDPPPGIPTKIESLMYWPGGIHADANGVVYVADSANSRLVVFDPTGAPLFTLGTYGQVYTTLDYPDPSGDCLDVFYNIIDSSLCPNDPSKLLGRFVWPADVTTSPDGQKIFVADALNHRIQIFTRNDSAPLTSPTTVVASNGWRYVGSALGTFKKSGVNDLAGPGQFSFPNGVDFNAANGRIAVADTDNGRIVVLDPSATGSVQTTAGVRYTGFTFGHDGNSFNPPIQDELNYPHDVKMGADGRIVVADTSNNQVKIFTSTGAGAGIVGAEASSEPGKFKYVAGVSVYPNGDILVADADNGRLQLIQRTATGYAIAPNQYASVSSPNGVAIIGNRVIASEFTGHDFVSLGALGLRVTSVATPAPAEIAAGKPTAISFVVQNSGATRIQHVTPILTNAAAAACDETTGPADSGPVDLDVLASHTFVVCATGSIPDTTVAAKVAASGDWSGFVYRTADADAPFHVRGLDHPSVLFAGSAPANAPIDNAFTVTFTVTNNGNVALTNLALTLAYNGNATQQPGAVTAIDSLAVGQSKDFTVPFKATAEGTFDVTGTVSAAEVTTAPAPVTVHVAIKSDTQPPVFQPFVIRGPGGILPNANGWIKDPTNLGATITATVSDVGSAGLAFARYAILGQQTGFAVLQPGAPGVTYTTIPVHANGQGRVLVAFWADDTAGNARAAGLFPRSAAGDLDTSPNGLRTFCAAVPQQCVLALVDTEVPQLSQERITISDDRTEARVYFSAKDGQSEVESLALTAGIQQNATARIEMEPNSNSRGMLVLTAKGTDVWARITVVDHAGFTNEFTLPFRGPNDPVLRLDNVAPEAFNRLDPTALGASCVKLGTNGVPLFTYFCTNKVYGTDNLPGLTTNAFAPVNVLPTIWGNGDNSAEDANFNGNAELHTTSFTDEYVPPAGAPPVVQSPNRVTLIEKVRQQGQEARVRVISYQYNAGPIITPDWAYKKYEWSNTVRGDFKTLNQKFEIGRGQNRVQVLANWDASKNQTTISELGPGPMKKVTVPGLILLRMTTKSGALKIEYDTRSPVPPPPPLPGKK